MCFHPNADPTTEEPCEVYDLTVEDRQALHRALMRGNGFYEWMTSTVSGARFRKLPVVDFFAFEDKAYADALVMEALPADRSRFRQYLSHRPLGLGIMTAGPGFGKTTAMAVTILVMQARLGRILCSGPSHVSVDNLAERIDRVSASVTQRCNAGKDVDARIRRKLVVRGYKLGLEDAAFLAVLKDSKDVEGAIPRQAWGKLSKWRLPLSLSFWVLVLLRSTAVRELHPDDSQWLHDFQKEMDERDDIAPLREVAIGERAWDDMGTDSATILKEKVPALMNAVLQHADFLCVTPALTENVAEYVEWKKSARGIGIDEAANMNRADLACVWGNTLLPCCMGGDEKQLPPTIMTGKEKDVAGNFIHRLVKDGTTSPLEFFQVSGIPIYRLKVQLRMARGLFDTVAEEIYPQVPFTYNPSCEVSLPQFDAGRKLEDFIRERFPGDEVKAPSAGCLSPFFVHCEGSRVDRDPITSSKQSKDQVTVALEFAADLVKSKGIRASQINILAPYAANVELIGSRIRKETRFAQHLAGTPPASTVDGFQGQENDIILVVMGTSAKVGPGFTTDARRLNVLLTRARAGLVLFGDINVTGPIVKLVAPKAKAGKGKGKGKVDDFKVVTASGEVAWTKAVALQNVHKALWSGGRVGKFVCVVGDKKPAKDGKEKA